MKGGKGDRDNPTGILGRVREKLLSQQMVSADKLSSITI